jgi:DNA-binding NarL/FixJ family response regulator
LTHRKKKKVKPTAPAIRVGVAAGTHMESSLIVDVLKRSPYSFDIVATVTSLAEARTALLDRDPHVVLVSLEMQGEATAGFTLLHELRKSDSKARCVLLLDAENDDLVTEAFRRGARGVYARSESAKDLPTCLFEVHQGQFWADSNMLQLILQALVDAPAPHLVNPEGMKLLQKREEEVAGLVAEGLTNRDIAKKLGLSEHTIKNYLFRIFDKLGVSSRAELIIYVLGHREHSRPPEEL